MLNRLYIKNCLSFEEVDLEFQKGLIVFTGVSGTGKSVLMNTLLSLFGQGDSKAQLSEATIQSIDILEPNYFIQPDTEFVIKQLRTTKTRYLLNNQTISKKLLNDFCKVFSRHLHLKDLSDFNSDKIIEFLDDLASKEYKDFKALKTKFSHLYAELSIINKKIKIIADKENDLERLKDFAKFEIDKIANINPTIEEFDELQNIKDKISKKDKISELIGKAESFLSNSYVISNAIDEIGSNSGFFDDTINEVIAIFEKSNDFIKELDDIDIENVLDRIEKLSGLKKQYGTIQEAINYKEKKEKELLEYENIFFEKDKLEKELKSTTKQIDELLIFITKFRKQSCEILKKEINNWVEYLYLGDIDIDIAEKSLDNTGCDKVEFKLNNTELKDISSGEFNRVRLALLTARSKYEINKGGILFLDEIDSNLSGKECESIAIVLKELSKKYQVFAISHQPQLSAAANQHFLVLKNDNISSVKELNDDEKIDEISRMISGKNIAKEAIIFAKNLINQTKG